LDYNGSFYWPGTSQRYYMYPKLESNVAIDTAIIGGGLTGTLCGYLLTKSGIPALLLNPREISCGSASADGGLIQYASEPMLCDLIDQIGERNAVRLYSAYKHAVDHLGLIAGSLTRDVGFKKRSSLRYAASAKDRDKLEREFRALRTYGFDVEYWSPGDIAAHFPFSGAGAILTHGDAEVNPFLFVHETAAAAIASGLKIYEHTEIVSHEEHDGIHRLLTDNGSVIEANHVIYTDSKELPCMQGRMLQTNRSRGSSIVTPPQSGLTGWDRRFLIREAGRPHMYMRTTPDGRIIAGLAAHAELPSEDQYFDYDRKSLMAIINEHFPAYDSSSAYQWSSFYNESRDGLPFIGEDLARNNVFHVLGYSGNTLVSGMLAAQIIRERLRGVMHPLADILRLNRPALVGAL
jgi:glycine/D-amino acid oxidase-like deaminating enzyme